MNSVLIGNGFDIQVGGDDYLNKWILVRMLAKAKMGKYDELFMSNAGETIMSGDDLIELFYKIIPIANKIIDKKYDDLINNFQDADLIAAANDFKNNHEKSIKSFEEIGMEDWFLVFMIWLIEQNNLLDQYKSIKQGLEQMILDAIYCEGNIQKLYLGINKNVKTYFRDFDSIFTLNYDNTIEKLTGQQVFHLHGDFDTAHPSENEQNALGYLRMLTKTNVRIPSQFKHSYCTAILDFSGNKKYKYASHMTTAFNLVENHKKNIHLGITNKEDVVYTCPHNTQEMIKTAIDKNLQVGQDYHFDKFEKLSGTLTIIGLAPQNDSHIFSCINKSNLDNVIFYCYFGNKTPEEIEQERKNITLPIDKNYEIRNIQDLWSKLKLPNKKRSKCSISDKQLELLTTISQAPEISKDNFLWQLESIPPTTKRVINKLINFEIAKEKYHTSPNSEAELFSYFRDVGKVLDIISVSPQVFYYFLLTNINSSKK